MYFALFMVIILAVSGMIWLLDTAVLRKNRAAGQAEPWYVEYAKSFFPVILLVFTLRSFLVEPFKIPSGSMMPTLLAGDYILVNKFTYGLRIPIFNNTFFGFSKPKKGDVIVFHYPPAPTVDYIKRVIGVPGDTVEYIDKQLIVNGKKIDMQYLSNYSYTKTYIDENGNEQGVKLTAQRISEKIGDINHDILIHDKSTGCNAPDIPPKNSIDKLVESLIEVRPITSEICEAFARNEKVVVPAGHYLAMGDNRDDSSDGRMWGFVPEQNLVGKAFYIWMNFDQFNRIGNSIK